MNHELGKGFAYEGGRNVNKNVVGVIIQRHKSFEITNVQIQLIGTIESQRESGQGIVSSYQSPYRFS